MTCCDWTSDERGDKPWQGRPARLRRPSAPQVARLLREQADDLAARIGARLELAGHRGAAARASRGPASTRRCSPPTPWAWRPAPTSTSWSRSSAASSRPARCCSRRMKNGKSVVTANKALLAEDGEQIHAAARALRRRPLLRGGGGRRDPAAAAAARVAGRRPVHRVLGIVNGTTNFILSGWTRPAPASPRRWRRRSALGYAEADPTADVEGVRRRGQGGDPGRRSRSTPGSPPPTSTARASPR